MRAATITVTRGANVVLTDSVPAKSVKALQLPWVPELTKGLGPTKRVVDGAYRLRSDRPVTVYQYNLLYASATNDASLLLPVNAWTGDYLVASYPHAAVNNYPGFYAVVARQDDTKVTLKPSATGGKVQAGGGVAADGTGEVVLMADDVLQVATAADGDLTGTLIHADKPVQVFGGHKCTQIPDGTTACDRLEEQMLPIETLSKQYIVTPPLQPDGTAPETPLASRVELGELVQMFASNPTWGFADASGNVRVRTSDKDSILLRRGLPPTRQQAQAAASDQLTVYRQIVEPGQSVSDLLTSAARRLNRLIGVAADGVLQVWTPDYDQTPLYRLDYHAADDPDVVRNNVITCQITDKIDTVYTRVEVVGQVVGWYPTDINDLAPGKFSSVATNPGALPFDHELTYADPEVWQKQLAPYAARFKLNRLLYDSFSAVYKVRAHHQGGNWWVAGTMCELHDSVNGYDGNYYVASIKQMRTRDGDQTEVTLKLPGLLAASFNRLPPA